MSDSGSSSASFLAPVVIPGGNAIDDFLPNNMSFHEVNNHKESGFLPTVSANKPPRPIGSSNRTDTASLSVPAAANASSFAPLLRPQFGDKERPVEDSGMAASAMRPMDSRMSFYRTSTKKKIPNRMASIRAAAASQAGDPLAEGAPSNGKENLGASFAVEVNPDLMMSALRAGGAQSTLLASMAPSAGGAKLHFKDLKVKVEVNETIDATTGRTLKSFMGKKKEKMILKGVSGTLDRGDILLVMGPSGSGKTTFLDLLADRLSLEHSGSILIDNEERQDGDAAFRMVCKYVPQNDDAFYSSFTVDRVMKYSGQFYCNDPKDREERITASLQALGLSNQRNVPVGGVFNRGLSGGQRRRLSVACELLAAPRLLILDEPTSGLDSAASFHLMDSLTQLVRDTGTTVICSIHQPSELIFNQSDKLLLLSRGRQMYFGPTEMAAVHFNDAGIYKQMSEMSVVEWLIDEINDDFAEVGSEIAGVHQEHIDMLLKHWPESEACKTIEQRYGLSDHDLKLLEMDETFVPDRSKGPEPDDVGSVKDSRSYHRTFFDQVWILFSRGFIVWLTNPVLFLGRFVFTVGIFLFMCAVFGHLSYTQGTLFLDFPAVIYFALGYGPVIGMSSIAAVQEEGHMIERERANGAFMIEAWCLARFILLVGFGFILTILPGPVLYYIIGFLPAVDRFFFFIWTMFWMNLTMEYVIHFAAGALRQTVLAVLAVSGYVGISALVFGFLKPLSEIGWWVRWLHYVTAGSYAFVALCVNQFNDPNQCYVTADGSCLYGLDFLNFLGFPTSNASKWLFSCLLIPYCFVFVMLLYCLEKYWRVGRR